MEKYRMEIFPDVFLTVLNTDRFRTNYLSLNILRPLQEKEAAMNALLPDVLLRGCRICPNMQEISAWMQKLMLGFASGVMVAMSVSATLQVNALFVAVAGRTVAVSFRCSPGSSWKVSFSSTISRTSVEAIVTVQDPSANAKSAPRAELIFWFVSWMVPPVNFSAEVRSKLKRVPL